MKNKKQLNRLILGKNYIEYTFNTYLSKSNLPIWKSEYKAHFNFDLKCFKINQYPSHNASLNQYEIREYSYKIVIPYVNSNLVLPIINDIIPHLFFQSIVLQISNNNCIDLINQLSELHCWECIIFSKNFSTHKYHQIKNMQQVKYVIYKGLWNENLTDLPSNIDILSIVVKNHDNKFISIPHGVKKILIEEKNKANRYFVDLENLEGIKNILFVSGSNFIPNYSNLNFEYLIYNHQNNFIDFTNIPSCVKILKIGCGIFNETLDYLPNSVEEIIFNSIINASLSNIPSSVNKVSIRVDETSCENIKRINELPDSVEILNLTFYAYKNYEYEVFANFAFAHLINLPKKIKVLNKNTSKFLIEIKNFFEKVNKIKLGKSLDFNICYCPNITPKNIYDQIKKYY